MDGVAICVENYAKWMQKMAGGVSVITPSVSGADYSKYDFEVLDYFSIPVPFRKPYVTGIGEVDPSFLAKIVKRPFKIVHAHSPFIAGRIASHVASLRNIPLVATFHSKYREDFSRVIPSDMLVNQAIKLVVEFYERADEVWVPQESVIDVLREYGYKGPVEVVMNGSDLVADYPDAYFADARNQLGIAPDEFALLFVGQHIWEKNVRMIIDALEQLKDIRFRMFFVGTGYAASDMKKLVSEKGLEDRVTFAGVIKDREALKQYYAAADLFLFPSLYDTDGIVVKEAAALHTPSVMLETATAASILRNDDNGFVVPDSLEAFTARIRALAGEPERVRRVGLQASRTLVRSWEDVVGEVLDRYNHIIGRKYLIPIK
ncbi:MAG: glycosyltransferase [Bacteroidales bacterium]|nr:glycosyltransferase [Bacteroidales bacterium]